MIRTPFALTAAGLFLVVATPVTAQSPVMRSAYHDYRVVTVADELVHPWSIAFLPEGDMLVTERPGRLRIVRNGTLLPDPVPGVPAVHAEGQGGLLDVVPHPDFASNRLLYLSFSKPNRRDLRGGVTRSRALRVSARVRPERVPVPHGRRPPGAAQGRSRGTPCPGSFQPPRDHYSTS